METPELVDRLQRLGFEPEEALVYVTLLKNGPSRASTLASLSDLNRTKVYRVLDDLVDRRFASASVGRPTIYRPEPPSTVFELLREDVEARERTIDRVEGAVREPLEELAHQSHEVSAPDWKVIQGYPRIYETLHRLIRSAEAEIFLVSNHPITTNVVPFVQAAWEEAIERAGEGVRFRALLGQELYEGGQADQWLSDPNVDVRTLSIDDPIHYVLFDREDVLKWLIMDPEGSTEAEQGAAILSDAPGLVTGARLLSERLWKEGQPLEPQND